MRHGIRRRLLRQFSLKSLAARVLGLLVFVWTTLYSPVHLLLEAHVEGPFQAATTQAEPRFCAEEPEHSHGGHEQHLASDHQLRATPQSPGSLEQCPVILSAVAVFDTPEPCFLRLFLTERVNPPGGVAPDPLLPRAPPLS